MSIRFRSVNGDCVVGVDIVDSKNFGEYILAHKNLSYQKTDILISQNVSKLFENIIKECGKIDVLFNFVGGFGKTADIEEVSDDEWDEVVNLNLKSIFLMAKNAVPLMKKNNYGRIISMAAVAGRQPQGKSCVSDEASSITGMTLDITGGLFMN